MMLWHVQVREAVFCSNYKALFRLYGTAPSMGRALMDIFIERFRYAGLNMVVRAHKPHVQLLFLTRILGFLAAADNNERTAPSAVAGGIPLPGSRLPEFVGKHAPQVLLQTLPLQVDLALQPMMVYSQQDCHRTRVKVNS